MAQGKTAAEVVADQTGPGAADDQPPAATPQPIQSGDRVVVTARRVEEDVQDVPIPVAVLSEDFLADTGAFNAGKISSLVPSVQFYSTNPRNSAINIRGIGSPFGLTNDGIEQGVGLYVDGVYYARPAADTALAQLCDAAGRSRWRHLVGSRRQGGLPRDLALCGCAVGR